jgi:signal peptidase I
VPLSSTRARRVVLGAAGGLGRAVLGLACLVLVATLAPALFGYERYVLVGRSMEPTIKRGSLVYDAVVPTRELRVGDVITYVPPGSQAPVTHRIVRSEPGPDGRPVFRTKGDNNPAEDLRPFTLDRPEQTRFAFAIPYAGYLFIALASQTARFVLLVLPALLLAVWMLARLWREAGRMLEEQRT